MPYERRLVAHLIEMLQRFDDIRISGVTDPAKYEYRVPTVVFSRALYARRLRSRSIWRSRTSTYGMGITTRSRSCGG
ncbi:MAG: hypothetical protein U0521_12165 [Anaerolineae bacterium]